MDINQAGQTLLNMFSKHSVEMLVDEVKERRQYQSCAQASCKIHQSVSRSGLV